MQLRRFLTVLRHRWLSVLALTVGGAAVAAAFSFLQTPTYSSQTSVFFSIQFGSSASELVQGSTYTQNSVTSFATLATKPIVLDPVIEDLGLDTTARALAEQVVAIAPLNTVIVEVAVTDTSPEQAAAIARAVGEQLSATVERLSPADVNGVATVQAEIVAPATVENSPVSPNISLNFAAGILVGMLAGVGFAFVRDTLDTRVRGAAEVMAITDAPLLGVIGAFPSGAAALVLQDIPSSSQAEAYRQIRTNLQFLGVNDQARSIVVTSALPEEGKSTVAANLALALAETSTRVLLVDADLRRPNVADLMSLEGAAGLTTVLIGRAEFDDVVQEWADTRLDVLTSGEVPPNPSELLASSAMQQLLVDLQQRYDFVILDTAPLLPVTDAAILSRVAVGTIVVANARRVRRGQLTEALGFLEQVDARVLGVVLNEAVKDSERYGYTPHPVNVDALATRRSSDLAERLATARSELDAGIGSAPVAEADNEVHEEVVVPPAKDRAGLATGATANEQSSSRNGGGTVANATSAPPGRNGNEPGDDDVEEVRSIDEVSSTSRPRVRPRPWA